MISWGRRGIDRFILQTQQLFNTFSYSFAGLRILSCDHAAICCDIGAEGSSFIVLCSAFSQCIFQQERNILGLLSQCFFFIREAGNRFVVDQKQAVGQLHIQQCCNPVAHAGYNATFFIDITRKLLKFGIVWEIPHRTVPPVK